MDQGILDDTVQVACVIARGRNSKLKRIFLRVVSKKGSNVAIVPFCQKGPLILHHLLNNKAMYNVDGIDKEVKIDIGK